MNLVIKEGQTKASVTKEFNLSQGIIKKWIDSYEASRTDNQTDLELRQRELEKENQLLKKGNDFLKKATAFFAKHIPTSRQKRYKKLRTLIIDTFFKHHQKMGAKMIDDYLTNQGMVK